MKKTIFSKALLLLTCVVIMISLPSATKKDEPVLIKATFFTHTNDDNKDHDTGVYVEVKTSDGQTTIVHANNRDNSGDDGTEYKDNSDHQFDLDIDAAGLEKSACGGYKVRVWQHTHGHDTWKFNGKVVLYFSNHTNLTASRDGIELKNEGASTEFSAH